MKIEILDSGTALYPQGWTVGPRELVSFEFVWILDGTVCWRVDGVEHDISPGTVVLARPGMRDFFQWDRSRATRYCFLGFGLTEADGHLPPVDEWPLIRVLPPDDLIRPLFRFVLLVPRRPPPGWSTQRENAAVNLLWAFVHDAHDLGSQGTPRLNSLVDAVLAHLRDTWTPPFRKITLDEMATVASVSPTHLCRVFKATLGQGPVETVRVLRLYWAGMALAWTDLPLAVVAEQAGFSDLFHFSRRFRQLYGMPPATFRRHHAEGTAFPHQIPHGAALAAARVWGARET